MSSAHDAQERSRWVTALEDTILRHTHRRRAKKTDQSQVPTLVDFERKLTETDAYLQLVIGQVSQLDQRIDQTTNETDKTKLQAIKTKTLTLLDGIKHTIVLLQIAKVCSKARIVCVNSVLDIIIGFQFRTQHIPSTEP